MVTLIADASCFSSGFWLRLQRWPGPRSRAPRRPGSAPPSRPPASPVTSRLTCGSRSPGHDQALERRAAPCSGACPGRPARECAFGMLREQASGRRPSRRSSPACTPSSSASSAALSRSGASPSRAASMTVCSTLACVPITSVLSSRNAVAARAACPRALVEEVDRRCRCTFLRGHALARRLDARATPCSGRSGRSRPRAPSPSPAGHAGAGCPRRRPGRRRAPG